MTDTMVGAIASGVVVILVGVGDMILRLRKIHVLVNSRLTKALEKISALEKLLKARSDGAD